MGGANSPRRTYRDSAATKAELLLAAREQVREVGVSEASARKIAARADVNQALISYHFDTVSDLIAASAAHVVDAEISHFRDRFEAAATFGDLLAIGEVIHDREAITGNAAFMTQILAAAPHDEAIAGAARYALCEWNSRIRAVLERLLGGAPEVDVAALTHLITAGFIGASLYGATDEDGGSAALAALTQVGRMADALGGAGLGGSGGGEGRGAPAAGQEEPESEGDEEHQHPVDGRRQ